MSTSDLVDGLHERPVPFLFLAHPLHLAHRASPAVYFADNVKEDSDGSVNPIRMN
jgi:hypothetical protein